jgi:hypothetical protein
VHIAARAQEKILAMVDDGQIVGAGELHGPPHHARAGHGLAIVGDRHRAGHDTNACDMGDSSAAVGFPVLLFWELAERIRRTNSMKSLTALLTLCIVAGAAFASAFQNGSFESPGGAPNVRYLGCSDGLVTGWINDAVPACAPSTVYPGATVDGIQYYVQGNEVDGITSAADGTSYVSFGANGTTGGTLQQTFDTFAGEIVQVNYLVSLDGNTPNQPQSMTVQAFDGVSLLGAEADNVFTNVFWENGPTLIFTATSASTTLVFTDTTGAHLGDEVNWGLDGVTVSSATPEPSTVSLFFLGSVALVALRRRKSRNWPAT